MQKKKDQKLQIPAGKSGRWKVEKFELTEEMLRFDFNNRLMGRQGAPGKYTKLTRDGKIVMSDTPAEMGDLSPLKWNAKGKVLIHGLGLGCAVDLCMGLPDVEAVTVIEVSADVIKLVAPTLKKKYGDRLTIIEADAYTWKPKGVKFDSVWSDIWDDICSDNLPEMKKLRFMWARRTTWHGFWCKLECMRAKRMSFESYGG